MKPLGKNFVNESISAMSAMNTHDDAKPFVGEYLTDSLNDVLLAHNFCASAIDSYPDIKCLNYIDSAITMLNRKDFNFITHAEKHSMLKHAIEHLESAKEIYNAKGKRIYKK